MSTTRRIILFIVLMVLMVLSITPATISPVQAASTPLPVIVNEYLNATITTDGASIYCGSWNITGYITVLNNNTGEAVSDIWLPLHTPPGVTWVSIAKPAYATVTNTTSASGVPSAVAAANSGANLFIHITELQSGDNVTIKYQYLGSGCPPINVSEAISPIKIVDAKNQRISVNLTIYNGLPFSVDFKVEKILPDDNGTEGWANLPNNPRFISGGTPSVGVSSYNYKRLNWTLNGGTLTTGGWFTIASSSSASLNGFQIEGVPNLTEVGGSTTKVPLGKVFLYFTAPHTFTGLKVGTVFAVGKAQIEAKKLQGTSAPNTWNESLVFYDSSGVFEYDIYNTTVWATNNTNVPNANIITGSVNTTQRFNIAQVPPGGSFSTVPWNFSNTGVPVVWGLVKFKISKSQTSGWWNYTNFTYTTDASGNSTYAVYEEIWVVRGYLIKAKKEVRTVAPENYSIMVSVENAGQYMTPYVQFYDVVPPGFTPGTNEGQMVFRPLAMLARDLVTTSPPDYSLITSPTGYTKGYVWECYPIPAPQKGFVDYFGGTGLSYAKNEVVTLANGTDVVLTVYPVSTSAVNVNGTDYLINQEFTVGTGAGATTFNVTWIDPLLATGGGYVMISATGTYSNLNKKVFNPVAIRYFVGGSGNYNASKLYIVGVDPRNILNARAVFNPRISVKVGATTMEPYFAIALIALLAAAFLLMRRR